MEPFQEIAPDHAAHDRKRTGAWVLAAGILAVLSAIIFWYASSSSRHQAAVTASSAAKRAQASQIRVQNITMSQAESFLNQQVTTISGELVNGGPRPVTAIILTIEFADQFGQVILRESRPAFSTSALELAPGQLRPFDATFERLPNDWNVQLPLVQVTDFQTLDKK